LKKAAQILRRREFGGGIDDDGDFFFLGGGNDFRQRQVAVVFKFGKMDNRCCFFADGRAHLPRIGLLYQPEFDDFQPCLAHSVVEAVAVTFLDEDLIFFDCAQIRQLPNFGRVGAGDAGRGGQGQAGGRPGGDIGGFDTKQPGNILTCFCQQLI
jgi:hypothetical protein